MCKRFSVLYLMLLIAIFISDRTFCLADEDAEINNQKENILSLIEKGKFSEAKAATEKMIIGFPGQAKLPDMLYWIAERFQRVDRFDEAKQICDQIIEDYPDSPWAKKAKMGKAMSDAMSLVVSGKYTEANEVTAQMASDFAGSPDLPEILYWIAERYERIGRSVEAKRDYQRLIDLFANNYFAKKAKLGIPRADVIALVVAEDFNKAGLDLDKMTADFASHPDLPETLYWLAYRYQDIGRIEDAKRLYNQITQNYANNLYTSKAVTQLFPDGDTGQAEVQDVNLNPVLEKAAVELYRIARGYEEANDFDSAAKKHTNGL